MNILLPDSWLREYLDTEATPKQMKEYLSLCGPSIERINIVGNDCVYDIEITSNRVDMASVYGIAREAAAILPRFGIHASLRHLKSQQVSSSSTSKLPLVIEDPNHLCNRLLAVILDNVSVGPAPDYIRERVEKSGIRSLNNLIDITNYVMMEVGHPCHVFDYDRIKTAKLILRKAKKGETLVTLDGKRCSLTQDDIIIDDKTGRIIDLPGIMGTENSVVTQSTKRIVFFIESNNPVAIRRTSMRLGIRTMAATINEKHPDPELAKTAFMRGIELYQEVCHAKRASNIIDIYPDPPKPKAVSVSVPFINKRLGVSVKQEEITDILRSLSFDVKLKGDALSVTPPSFRQFDVMIPEDIVEEVARLYGYHKLPSILMERPIPKREKQKELNREHAIKTMLTYWGYTELYTYSLISQDLIKKATGNPSEYLKLSNPLTEEIEYLRLSLVPSMLHTVSQNQNAKDTLALFELSHVYIPRKGELPHEKPMLVIAQQDDFFSLKGTVEALFEELGVLEYETKQDTNELFHPNQTAVMEKEDSLLARLGRIHPALAASFGISGSLFLAEVDIETLLGIKKETIPYTPLSKFPPIIEDMSLTLAPRTPVGNILQAIRVFDPLISEVNLIDSYHDTITIRIIYLHPDKNLTTDDISTIRNRITVQLTKTHNATIKTK